MADRRLQLPEIIVEDRRLGRNINHDPRSLLYKVEETAEPRSVRWERRIPIINQGLPKPGVGSCTCSSSVGVLGTEPFFDTLDKELQDLLQDATRAQELAKQLYSETTATDPFPGTYPPDDTGSDGLSAAKTLRRHGYINGFQHITSVAAAQNAIKSSPFINGTNWLTGMDEPDAEGIVHATGASRGGHEWEIEGYDSSRDLWICPNTWGTDFGKDGYFYLPSEDLETLLNQQGDSTTFTPNTQPPPTPAPVSTLGKIPDDVLQRIKPWLDMPRSWTKSTAAADFIKERARAQ